jgi:hypothetical protein
VFTLFFLNHYYLELNYYRIFPSTKLNLPSPGRRGVQTAGRFEVDLRFIPVFSSFLRKQESRTESKRKKPLDTRFREYDITVTLSEGWLMFTLFTFRLISLRLKVGGSTIPEGDTKPFVRGEQKEPSFLNGR